MFDCCAKNEMLSGVPKPIAVNYDDISEGVWWKGASEDGYIETMLDAMDALESYHCFGLEGNLTGMYIDGRLEWMKKLTERIYDLEGTKEIKLYRTEFCSSGGFRFLLPYCYNLSSAEEFNKMHPTETRVVTSIIPVKNILFDLRYLDVYFGKHLGSGVWDRLFETQVGIGEVIVISDALSADK